MSAAPRSNPVAMVGFKLSPDLKPGEPPFTITAVQMFLLLIAWCLACVTLAGASDDDAIMESSSWAHVSVQGIEIYMNFWGICSRSQASSVSCAEWNLSTNPKQKNAKDGLLAMAALGWIATSAMMLAVVLKFFAQTPSAAKTYIMAGSVTGALAWLFSLATWAQAAAGWMPESPAFDVEWGPGFGASVTQWMFVMIALVLNVVHSVSYPPEKNSAGVDTRQGTHAPTLKAGKAGIGELGAASNMGQTPTV